MHEGVHQLRVRCRFEAAHRLSKSKGDCRHVHGHSFQVLLFVEHSSLTDGMVLDSDQVKQAAAACLNELDHSLLLNQGDTSALAEVCKAQGFKCMLFDDDPTAEVLAAYIYRKCKVRLPKLVRVEVVETENLVGAYYAAARA